MREEELRDLGFGSVVSRESQQRLLNRDGTFNVRRDGLSFWRSLSAYHWLLTMPWWKFTSLMALAYVAVNMLFAGAYLLCGPDGLKNNGSEIASPVLRAFFFSVHTFSTVGYGNILPETTAANAVVTAEALAGLLGFALSTGLIFARFSRPTAQILFSKQAVIAPYQEMRAFMFRIANARQNQLIEVSAKVLLTRFELENGVRMRRYYFLELERRSVTFFPLTWTVVHPIDQNSPLYGVSPEHLAASNAELLVLLTGTDETFSQIVHARSSYRFDEVVWGARFGNIFAKYDSEVGVDMRAFHDIDPAPLP
jgi:inward rectifier potassium channel